MPEYVISSHTPLDQPTHPRAIAMSDISYEYSFPAIRGLQAGKAYYVTMCPLRLLPKIFLFDEAEVAPELRAQRSLNRARLPEMARYILDNQDSYVFSAITASVDSEVRFEPIDDTPLERNVGKLRIPMSARFIINDGQHRRAAIEMALREAPEIGDESIAVVFFLDPKLDRCQQMFADLNRYAIRPSRSLGVLYDQRDEYSLLAKEVVRRATVFRGVVEYERSSLALRSGKIFTLSSIQTATKMLLAEHQALPFEEQVALGAAYWDEVARYMKEWSLVRDRELTAGEFRSGFVNAHALALTALGQAGRALLLAEPKNWKRRIKGLAKLDWSRANTDLWEGRAMVGGRISKAGANVLCTSAVIKRAYGLPLSPDEVELERRMGNGG